ncbi:MAG TPA: beta-ketoacyl-ACP synthase III [Acidobacteriota bacterium]|nr:beta-ketoacyl-ACP synthase III [Acidobacteriota bacterium]HNT16680.1 beta-ketoacyl-ACP synthase III [Acidobacteriota bacterium]HPA26257.1 beta-ketoacyl-ACP synthase III [Acidobacteriota bacterium]HQO19559.1 beta-ketoacyl-ACP synthase III [Acidobacteriota bacterium]HQQ46265.1 beta-ketoacyl-ACP synthase III [Acidobacteriota bacterium]
MEKLKARIVGTGRSLPEKVLTNFDLEKIVDTSDEWIRTRTGIRERRIASENESLSDFASGAAKNALEMAGVKPEEVDLILLGTVTMDQPIPATSCFVQHRIGAVNAASFDFQAGCTGFIYGLSIADQYIRSGAAKKVLLIGGEVLSKVLDWKDRATCVLFGDGCGAVLLSAETGDRGILASAIHSDGSMADFITMPGGGSKIPASHKSVDDNLHVVKMMGNETFKVAVRRIEGACREALEKADIPPEQVKWFIPHQANTRIISAVAERLGWPSEKYVINIDRIGNTSAGSIPIALDEIVREGKVSDNDILIFSAFGAGVTWGASVIRW